MSSPLFILAVLSLLIALSEALGSTRWGRHMGSALLVIVLTAIVANLGWIPTYSDEIDVYRVIFGAVAPMAIFLLVLQVNLRKILRAGLPMIGMFLLGAVGTTLGVFIGLWLVGGEEAFGSLYRALGGMFVATYVGGSINYNAVALHYDVVKQATLYAGAAAVDSAMTTVWMVVMVALPRWLGRRSGASSDGAPKPKDSARGPLEVDTETVNARDLGILVALAGLAVWASGLIGARTSVPSILIVTTLSLALAQVGPIQSLRGARILGWLAVMYFLAVIGALCDLEALAAIGDIGTS